LSKIDVRGKIKFWKDSKRQVVTNDIRNEIVESEMEIPHWDFQYITSNESIKYFSEEIQNFYSYFKDQFNKNIFLDVKGETNYLFTLLIEMKNEFFISENLPLFIQRCKLLDDHYPILRHYTNRWTIEILDNRKEFELLKQYMLSSEYYLQLIPYFYILQRTKDKNVSVEIILSLIKTSSLTTFGQNNINEIKPFFNERLIKKLDFLVELMSWTERYDSLNSIHMTEEEFLLERKFLTKMERELRDSENDFREKIGVPRIGEGWISETELYYRIKEEFSQYAVIHHGKPKWLGRQHLDIYIEEISIGIEYMGAQHYEPIDFFGGEDSLMKTKERDIQKVNKCRDNRCSLIVVNEGYSFDMVRNSIDIIIKENEIKHRYIII
jgi:hypothetical protein